MYVKDVFSSPGGCVNCVITRAKVPIAFARDWIDGNTSQVKLGLWDCRLFGCRFSGRVVQIAAPAQSANSDGQHAHPFYEGIEIRRITIRIIDGENCLIGNKNADP